METTSSNQTQFVQRYCVDSGISLTQFQALLALDVSPLTGTLSVVPMRILEMSISTTTPEDLWAIMLRVEQELLLFRQIEDQASRECTEPLDLTISAMVIVVLLNSVLDLSAAQLRMRLDPPINNPKFLPGFPLCDTLAEFELAIDQNFPGVRDKFPGNYHGLRILQPFELGSRSEKLPEKLSARGLRAAANIYKHRHLRKVVAFRERLGSTVEFNLYHFEGEHPLTAEECFSHYQALAQAAIGEVATPLEP